MKRILLLSLLLALAPAARAALIYSGIVNVPIPQDFEGVYLRIDTGALAYAFPADWETAPWINPFFGGVGIGTSPLLRPVITGADQILRLETGTVVGPGSNFAPGENGSATHVGAGAGQFQLGQPGTIGLVFESVGGGPSYYGWVDVKIENAGPGQIVSWAFDPEGDSVTVPEPATAAAPLAALLGLTLLWRRRRPI